MLFYITQLVYTDKYLEDKKTSRFRKQPVFRRSWQCM